MAEAWEPASHVQKNEAGEYRALINDQWVPVTRAQKNDAGEFRVMRADVPSTEPSTLETANRTAGIVLRGAGPVAAGAIAGGVAGSIVPGVGTVAGAAAGAAAGGLTQLIDKLAGTNYIDTLLDRAGVPKAETATERILQDVSGAVGAQGAVMGGGQLMAKAAGPVVSRVGQVMASQPGLQTVTAATGGASGGATREAGGGPIAQTAASSAGGMTPALARSVITRKAVSPETSALLAESKRRDVPLTYADITGRGRRLDTALEQVPILGTSRFREAGAKKVTAAIEEYADDVAQSMRRSDYRGLDALKTAAAAGDKSARNTLEQINNAGDDWTKIMQASGNLKLWQSRQEANRLYSKVGELAKKEGEMLLPSTNKALDSAIEAEMSSKLPDKQLLDTLNGIKHGLYREGHSVNDFNAMRQLRSDLGDIIQNYYKGANALVGAKGVDKLQALRNAVEKDMEDFATSKGGEIAKAWRQADQFYKAAVVPYKDKALAGALKSDLPDEIYNKFVQVSRSGAGEDRAQKFYDALDPKGRAAVRYGMIANAIDSAVIPEKQGLISPGKFEQSLENIRNASGVFFKGSDKTELDGFRNLMEHARRFGQFTENPPTGQRVIPWLMLGGAAIRPMEMAGVGTAAYAARLLVTTEAGKRFLLEASILKPGSPAMQRLSDELARQMPRLASQQAAPRRTEQQAQPEPIQ